MPTAYKTLAASVVGSTASATVSNKALASSVATLTTGAAHGFAIGDVVTVYGVDSTFDGVYTVATVPLTTTFTYAKASASVASAAVSPNGVAIRQFSQGGQTTSNKYSINGISTVTTASNHGFAVDDWIRVTQGDTSMDGLVKVIAVPSATTFMYSTGGASVASAAMSTGGVGRNQASAWVSLYQPSSASAIISTMNVANLSASSAQYRVAVSTTASPTRAETRIFDATVPANDSVFLTLGWVIQNGWRVMVNANNPLVSFSVDGTENT